MADAYAAAAQAEGAEVRRQNLAEMDFDPNLQEGYRARMELEPCLEEWRENILWANHLAWFYPIWWGGMPAKMKGVLDRAFLPGFAMTYHEKDPFWDRLLKGRSAEVFHTAHSPAFWERWVYGRPAAKQVRKLVLEFAGIQPVTIRHFGSTRNLKPAKAKQWVAAAEKAGAKQASRQKKT